MWSEKTSAGFEARKCRDRITEYLHGFILDIGCGAEKIVPYAIGIDRFEGADIRIDMNAPKPLGLFADNAVDVVFSSHFLEDCFDHIGTLKEMWRVIKPHGKLILYLPHKYFYPNIGKPGANPNHKHDFLPSDIIDALDSFASYRLLRNESYEGSDEYSFEIVAEKLDTPVRIVLDGREEIPEKSVLICRFGAVGDMLMMTPAIRVFKERGYKVFLNTLPDGYEALRYNPNIDKWFFVQANTIPDGQMTPYMENIKKRFPKVINLCYNFQSMTLFERIHKEFHYNDAVRDHLASENYYDRIMRACGLPDRGVLPEFHLSEGEEAIGQYIRNKYRTKFLVLWQLSGSSDHKLYPYADQVIEYLVPRYPDMVFFLTGSNRQVQVLQPNEHPQIKPRVGVWNLRQPMVMSKFVDLVISPETAVLHAAGAFDTPKIGLLTHSRRENVTKYFKNDYSLQAQVECSPCHKLVHSFYECPNRDRMALCMADGFPPRKIIKQILRVYQQWEKYGSRPLTEN